MLWLSCLAWTAGRTPATRLTRFLKNHPFCSALLNLYQFSLPLHSFGSFLLLTLSIAASYIAGCSSHYLLRRPHIANFRLPLHKFLLRAAVIGPSSQRLTIKTHPLAPSNSIFHLRSCALGKTAELFQQQGSSTIVQSAQRQPVLILPHKQTPTVNLPQSTTSPRARLFPILTPST
jgi:hypothetical protein